jgi:hypothetical protein
MRLVALESSPVKRPGLVADALELRRLPAVRIEMSGDEGCRGLYEAFTRRHARWRVVKSKQWGVALLQIPERHEDYLADPGRAHLRRMMRRAERAGYTFTRIDPPSRIQEVLAINRSGATRQGQPMHPDYLDEAKVRRHLERSRDVFGITDRTGVLRAYFSIRVCGDVAVLERLLGDADLLNDGIVWLLVAETIRVMGERRRAEGHPTWFMYDAFFGATPGMRKFKQMLGLEPYRVSWSWRG